MKDTKYVFHHGDSLRVLKALPSNSVDSIVTDPPYGIAFMGKRWDYDVPSVDVWTQCLRILKPGGHLLAFAGTRTQHRMAVRIEDAGFEIRDMIAWVYGSGFPKSSNQGGDWEGWGTALKPALEPITVARKPLEGTVAANITKHGTGALNIDACRIESADSKGGEHTVKRFAPGADINREGKWKQEQDFTGNMKPGRWPANLIHDGSEEVVELFPESAGQQGRASTGGGRGKNAIYGVLKNTTKNPEPRNDRGSASRFFYCAKASRKDRGPANNHPTVKPTELMGYLCRLVTPPGGIVLDPYMGSGSTCLGAVMGGFRFIGIEREEDYICIAESRMAGLLGTPDK